jgi:arylsulfatase A-like enzyme
MAARIPLLLFWLCGLVPRLALGQDAQPPNIVYILADDYGYGDARCYNADSKIPTPSVDRLATEGMRFTDAHSGSAVCSPTRYGILTGRYAWRTNLRRGVLQPYDPPLIAAGRLTAPALLKQHGYHTACIGKWHLGWDWPRRGGEVVFDQPIAGGPTARGFDSYFGTHVPNHPPYVFIEDDRTVGQPTAMKEVRDLNGRPGPMLPGWKFDAILPALAEKAVAYIAERANTDKPFFLYFPLTSPHEPIAPSERFRGKSGISDLADFMLETDWAVGQVLEALDKHRLAPNTLVIFTCDNGHSKYTGLPALEKAGHKASGPLRGYKTDIWEGGHRVPFVVRWPGKVKPGSQCDETICHTNLIATCAELLGTKLPGDAGEDSFSILPLLLGKKQDRPAYPAVVHQAADGTLAIRRGRWKLVLGALAPDGKPEADQLYDLQTDLGETRDVSAEHMGEAAELRDLLTIYIDQGRSTPGPAQKNDVRVPLRLPRPMAKAKAK